MTCKEYILELLEGKPEGMAGGTIETMVADIFTFKAGTVNRRLRDISEKNDPYKLLDKEQRQPKNHIHYRLMKYAKPKVDKYELYN